MASGGDAGPYADPEANIPSEDIDLEQDFEDDD